MIKLIDLLKIAGVYLNSYKIHCAAGRDDSPLEAFFEGRFKAWQEHQNQQNFRCDEIISLIHLQEDRWLFAGLYQVLGVKHRKEGENSWFEYGTKEMTGIEHLTGRLVVQFRKRFIASHLIGTKYIDKLLVSEIREKRIRVADFGRCGETVLPVTAYRCEEKLAAVEGRTEQCERGLSGHGQPYRQTFCRQRP